MRKWAERDAKFDELFGYAESQPSHAILMNLARRYLVEPHSVDGAVIVRLDNLADQICDLVCTTPVR